MSSIVRSRVQAVLLRPPASSVFREASSATRVQDDWDENPFMYFYNEATDVFWHNMEGYQGSGILQSRMGKSPQYRAAAIRTHNDRVAQDWADYHEGHTGQAERLQTVQGRLEQDMLDNAFVERSRHMMSCLKRGTHTSASMASQWMNAAEGAATFLQDCIIFRGENLERLAECGDVAWLPCVNTIKSYRGLLSTPLAPLQAPLPPTPSWVPYLSLVTPHNAVACGALSLQHTLMRKAFARGRKVALREQPQVSQVTYSIGAALEASANATALQLRVAGHARAAAQSKAIRSRHSKASEPPLSPSVQVALPLLAQIRTPARFGVHISASSQEMKTRVLRELQQGALSANRSTTTAIGAVLLQVMMMQLTARDLKPLFRQPVPWKLLHSHPVGPQRKIDYELESDQFPVERLTDYRTVTDTVNPIYGPCLTPPLPWVAPNRGCYRLCHEDNNFRVSFMRTKNPLQHKLLMQKHGSALADRLKANSNAQLQLQLQQRENSDIDTGGLESGTAPTAQLAAVEGSGSSPKGAAAVNNVVNEALDAEEQPDSGLWEVFNALNVLGSQGWSINSRVLRVVQAVDETQEPIADVPVRDPPPPPRASKPHFHASTRYFLTQREGSWRLVSGPMLVCFQGLTYLDTQREAKRIAAAARDFFNVKSQRGMFNKQLQSALAHELYSPIYFPHNVDFRGRAYPMPPHLNHMGADICRGLLQFSEAQPLGAQGFQWLLIHLANVCGVVDKRPFEGRLMWSLENLPEVLDSADAPLSGRRWWLQAENPWTALATCMEITSALRSGDVTQYRSKLPVHQDGSCNGLQHYAALGGDVAGAAAVNLVDAPEPQDVYGVVAERFAKLVKDEAATGGNTPAALNAQKLLGHTDRKLVKQTVMTTVYGVTMRGARDQVANRLIERGWPRDAQTSMVANYAASRILEALEGLFSSAKIMTWLRESAKSVAKQCEKTVQWTTPLGLPVLQPYFKEDKSSSPMQPLTLNPARSGWDAIAQPDKQSSAFPPNYVHSLDATHMMMTARECHARGLAFAGVHDSFWTHAAHVDTCRDVIREQFVEMYQAPLLERLKEDLDRSVAAAYQNDSPVANAADVDDATAAAEAQEESQTRESSEDDPFVIAPVPKRGSFDLNEVTKSTYFFN